MERGKIKMSCSHNESLLEKYYQEFLEQGYSRKEADKLAREKLEKESTPMPIEIRETVSGCEDSKPDWQKEQSEELIKKYGHDNWRDWSNDKWGTKWNACHTEVTQTKNLLTYSFDTAWDAPRRIVETICELQKTILKNVKIEWECVHEDGRQFEQLVA